MTPEEQRREQRRTASSDEQRRSNAGNGQNRRNRRSGQRTEQRTPTDTPSNAVSPPFYTRGERVLAPDPRRQPTPALLAHHDQTLAFVRDRAALIGCDCVYDTITVAGTPDGPTRVLVVHKAGCRRRREQ
jgi:hypothetical protein